MWNYTGVFHLLGRGCPPVPVKNWGCYTSAFKLHLWSHCRTSFRIPCAWETFMCPPPMSSGSELGRVHRNVHSHSRGLEKRLRILISHQLPCWSPRSSMCHDGGASTPTHLHCWVCETRPVCFLAEPLPCRASPVMKRKNTRKTDQQDTVEVPRGSLMSPQVYSDPWKYFPSTPAVFLPLVMLLVGLEHLFPAKIFEVKKYFWPTPTNRTEGSCLQGSLGHVFIAHGWA